MGVTPDRTRAGGSSCKEQPRISPASLGCSYSGFAFLRKCTLSAAGWIPLETGKKSAPGSSKLVWTQSCPAPGAPTSPQAVCEGTVGHLPWAAATSSANWSQEELPRPQNALGAAQTPKHFGVLPYRSCGDPQPPVLPQAGLEGLLAAAQGQQLLQPQRTGQGEMVPALSKPKLFLTLN